jgi:hypothetical protein
MHFEIAGRKFGKKIDLAKYSQSMKQRLPLGADLGPEDHTFVVELARRHKDARKLVGPGIRRVWLQTWDLGRLLVWGAEQADGKRVQLLGLDFIDLLVSGERANRALAYAVKHELLMFKRRRGGPPHPEVFLNARDAFLEARGLVLAEVPVRVRRDGTPVLSDPAFRAAWREHFRQVLTGVTGAYTPEPEPVAEAPPVPPVQEVVGCKGCRDGGDVPHSCSPLTSVLPAKREPEAVLPPPRRRARFA